MRLSSINRYDLPDSNKVNLDVDGKSLLELVAHFPAYWIGSLVHLVRKRDLLKIAGGEEANLVEHSC